MAEATIQSGSKSDSTPDSKPDPRSGSRSGSHAAAGPSTAGRPATGRLPAAVDPALYPFEGRRFEVGGHQLHCLDEGAGPPVLMVHGNPSWSFYYRDMVRALRSTHRCIVPDHIGCGLSDKPGDDTYDYTLGRRIDDLDALVEQLAPGPLTLMVHDWGGAIGLGWAARHPELVERLVILNTAAFHNPRGLSIPPSLWLARNTKLGALLVQGLNAFSAGATRLAVERRLPAAVRKAYIAPYDSWDTRVATLRFVQDIPLSEQDPAWAHIEAAAAGLSHFTETPALICWGERDFVFDAPFLDEWQRRLPQAEVHRFPDGGHYILEDEGPAIRGHVQRFFDAHPVAGERRP